MESNVVKLKQHKMSMMTVAFMIYCLCAGGCFGLEDLISALGPGLALLMLAVVPIIYGYPTGLVCAELGSIIPDEGGFYIWTREACGEFWGFQSGWWRTVGTYIDTTLYIILGGEYIGAAFSLSDPQTFAVKMSFIIFFTVVNLRGIKDVGTLSTIFAILVLVVFTAVAIVGFMNWNQNPFVPFMPEGESLSATLGSGLAICMWCYCGYESMSTIAGEMENPQVIPKALIIAIPAIALTYIIPTMASVAAIGHWDEWGSDGGYSFADVMNICIGPGFGVAFAVAAVIANLSIYNTYIASGSRGFYVLAEDHLCPPVLTKISKKGGVPYVAILLVALVNIILCNFAFSAVVVIGVFVYMFSQVMIMISGVILRKKIPNREGTFKLKINDTLFLVMSIIPVLVIILALFLNGTDYFVGGILGVLSGPVAYIIFKLKYGGLTINDPVHYPLNPRTGLGYQDFNHLSIICFVLALIAALGYFFLPWYEGSWGPEYYAETYGVENMFEILITFIKYGAFALFGMSVIFHMVHKKTNSGNSKCEVGKGGCYAAGNKDIGTEADRTNS